MSSITKYILINLPLAWRFLWKLFLQKMVYPWIIIFKQSKIQHSQTLTIINFFTTVHSFVWLDAYKKRVVFIVSIKKYLRRRENRCTGCLISSRQLTKINDWIWRQHVFIPDTYGVSHIFIRVSSTLQQSKKQSKQ